MTITNLSTRCIGDAARWVRICLATGGVLAASACTPSSEPTHQTVEYYRTNADARAEKLAQCENDPGALGQTPDCINARQAARQETKSLRDLAPLNLPEALPYKERREPGGQGESAEREQSGNR